MDIRRKMALIITVLALMLTLFACKGDHGDNNQGDDNQDTGADDGSDGVTDGEAQVPEDAIFGSGIRTYIVSRFNISDKSDKEYLISYINAIGEKTGTSPTNKSDTEQNVGHEIVLGETGRAISKTAKEKLEARIKREIRNSADENFAAEDYVGYAIYADGDSVAVVWSDYNVRNIALDYFLENYVIDSSLVLKDGYTNTNVFSISEYLEERGNRIREEQWAALEKAIGAEHGKKVVDSMRQLYTIYTPDAVSWLANLYDPVTGGFYYSNSARDTMGYLPDIESTYGAFGFVTRTGMAEMYGNDASKALPSWLLDKVGAWVQSLQDADGYFYHPQWPKDFINERGLQSRITRDRGSAISILRITGYTALYSSASSLDGTLSARRNEAVAVSKAVAVAGVLSQFESVTSFQNYINKLDAEVLAIEDPDARAGRLYAIGNEFQSTVSLVKANPEYVKILHEFFKKHQNPTTGTWSSVLTFNATNSLHKIGYVYNSLGLKYDYIQEMIDTVINILSRDAETDPIYSGVDFANAWAGLEHIYSNIRRCSDTPEEAETKLAEVKSYVYANITRAIDATFSQLVGFLQDDGSFGYTRDGSSATSQGCPVAVSGSAEGDVNGHGCISYTITNYIAVALDLPEYEVMMYSEKERYEFVRILEKLGPIVKDEMELGEEVVYTFDDGILPEQIDVSVSVGKIPTVGASVGVESIGGEKVMHVVAVDRKGVSEMMNHSISVPINLTAAGATVAVMEFDLCVYDEGSTANPAMIQWAMRGNGALILYPTIGKTSAGKVLLYDSNGAVTCELGNVDEKINLRFEYFWGDQEYKIYVNGMYKTKGNVHYSKAARNVHLTSMSFYTPTSLYANYYVDNLRCSRIAKYNNPNETVQFPKEPLTEDFEGDVTSVKYGEGYNVTTENGFSALYSNKYTNNGGATAVVRTDEESGNKFLSVYAPQRANSEYSHSLKMSVPTQMAEKPNAYVFEASLKLNSVCTARNFIQIIFLNTASGYRYGQLNMSVNGDGMICLAGLPIGYFDEWFDLRLEYHFDKGVIRAYNNDLFMGEITAFSTSDSITANNVAALDSLTDFSLGTINSGGSLSFSIDNLALYVTELEYTEREIDPLGEPNPDPDNFLPDATKPEPELDPEPDSDVTFPGMEPTVVETFEDSYEENLLSFPDGTTIDCPSFGDYVTTSFPNTASYTNTTGESVAKVVEYVTADGTSKALNMYSPGRINSDGTTNSSNRSHTATFKIMESVVPEDKVNAAALEFDMKLGLTIPEGSCAKTVSTSPIQLIFRNYQGDGTANTNNEYFQINPSLDVANKVLTICGVKISNIDEFVRIKLVADIEDKIVHVYANGVLMGSGAPDQGSDPWAVFAQYGVPVSTVHCFNNGGMADVYLDNVSFYNTYCIE